MTSETRRRKLMDKGLQGPLLERTSLPDPSWMPGDLGFCHSIGFVGWGIRQDQKWAGDYQWQVNHMFILDQPVYKARTDGLSPPLITDWWVIQAETQGVTRSLLSTVAPGGYYEIITAPKIADRYLILEFAQANLGAKYGFWSIASIVATEITPKAIRFSFRKEGTWICSALGAEALRYAGWYFPWEDIYQVRPAQVRQALKEQSRRDKTHLRVFATVNETRSSLGLPVLYDQELTA